MPPQFLLQPFAVLAALAIFARIEILMANKPKGYGTWDAALGLVLTGLAILLFLALVSYQPSDLPPWAKLIYDSNVRSPIVHNLCGIVGAVAAGYLYFFLEPPRISGSSSSPDTALPS